MTAASLDTHRIVERLREAGFSDAQPETVTDVLMETRGFDLARLATKDDLSRALADLKAELKADIAAIRLEIADDRAATKAEFANQAAATKAEFAALRREIAEDRAATKAMIDAAKLDMTRWFVALLLGQTAVLAALFRFL